MTVADKKDDQKIFSSDSTEEFQICLLPDKNISLGKFKPDPLVPGKYMAHPITIKAVRKELFAAGDEFFLNLEDKHICSSCSKEIDRQFWIFCPFCEKSF